MKDKFLVKLGVIVTCQVAATILLLVVFILTLNKISPAGP
jgi:hypothetical protein